jgi:hypothetical protein
MIRFRLITLFLFLTALLFSQKINKNNKHGKRVGKWVVYLDSAKKIKSFEGRFRNGRPVGKALYYTIDGVLERREITRFGKLRTTLYYANGIKSMKGEARIDDLPDRIHYYFYGRWKFYDEEGKLIRYSFYEKGRLVWTVYIDKHVRSNDSLINILVTLEKQFNIKNGLLLDSMTRDYHNIASRERFQRKIYRSDTLTFHKLDVFLVRYGYPSKKEFGEASLIPFYILSNAPVAVKEKYLNILTEAANHGDLEWKTLAFYIDKMRVAQGNKQVYGTQYYITTGHEVVYYPSEDPENLTKRRRDVGLE